MSPSPHLPGGPVVLDAELPRGRLRRLVPVFGWETGELRQGARPPGTRRHGGGGRAGRAAASGGTRHARAHGRPRPSGRGAAPAPKGPAPDQRLLRRPGRRGPTPPRPASAIRRIRASSHRADPGVRGLLVGRMPARDWRGQCCVVHAPGTRGRPAAGLAIVLPATAGGTQGGAQGPAGLSASPSVPLAWHPCAKLGRGAQADHPAVLRRRQLRPPWGGGEPSAHLPWRLGCDLRLGPGNAAGGGRGR